MSIKTAVAFDFAVAGVLQHIEDALCAPGSSSRSVSRADVPSRYRFIRVPCLFFSATSRIVAPLCLAIEKLQPGLHERARHGSRHPGAAIPADPMG
jgi:hypothetical protein